jgi:Tfp pilus assembly protein PilX
MKRRFNLKLAGPIRDEAGSALILVLVLMVLGGLVLLPALAATGTALHTGPGYQQKSDAFYAADAGIEDGICQIRNDQLPYVLAGQGYNKYIYGTDWSYTLRAPVNRLATTVTVNNVWIPREDAVTPIPPPSDPDMVATAIAAGKLMVSGTADEPSTYEINISFTPDAGDNLTIKSIGVWLPFGFSYDTGTSNLEELEAFDPFHAVPTVFDHAGGKGVVWDFPLRPGITGFPTYAFSGGVQTARLTFDYTANETGAKPEAIAWMVTDEYLTIENILPVTWDIDTSIYRISSIAGDTEIEAYISRNELRGTDDAIAGDYRATGDSLMRNLDGDQYGIRDYLLDESSATISTIPSDAVVTEAYLYWAAWFDESRVLSGDNPGDWNRGASWSMPYSYYYDNGWQRDYYFRGHYSSGGESARYMTSDPVDLSGLSPDAVVEVRWDQWIGGTLEPTDALYYQFYDPAADNWSEPHTAFAGNIDQTSERFSTNVPTQYWQNGFRLRFYLNDFAGNGEYCYLNDVAITWYVPTADTSARFEINGHQVYLDGNGDPQQGLQELTTSPSEVGFVDNLRGYSYRIKKDVTKLIQAYSDNGDTEHLAGNGNGTYTVGSVDGDLNDQLSWGGWSLIVIYASPETAGHRLYLFDRFAFDRGYENMDFDFDGSPGGDIEGFIIPDLIEGDPDPYAGHMTCFVGEGDNFITGDELKFTGQSGNYMYLSNSASPWDNVWNMQSPDMTFDGVDVDPFNIPWKSGSGQDLVVPGDTTAHLDLPSDTSGGHQGSDAWNLVYLILSLRSKTTTSGTTHYVIHNY